MIVDGKKIAEGVYQELLARGEAFARPLKLGILVGEASPVIESFVRIKGRAAERLGVEIVRAELSEGAETLDAIQALQTLALGCDGVIVQLPLPPSIDTERVIAAIPPEKDVDGIAPESRAIAPVALAVVEILKRNQINPSEKHAVVLGNGRLVGEPTAQLLHTQGADVSIVTLEAGSLESLKDADIVVCGAGSPGLVQPKHLKQGVVLIDAGTSEQGGAVRGDADPTCASKAALFTPVPGGVGPVAVAMIFKNLFDLSL
jgi:methylenetetrahydrofolate dehydrogenase (NADP+)/methenyltetrahydrofolate cyclohydrolase